MSESQPLVSVIIPAYNAAPYIAQAIDSVLAQTYPHIEILVAYRQSSDGTETVLQPYIATQKIICLTQEGRGLSNARNVAIRQARGEYIALLDADDLFLPERIVAQVEYFRTHPNCDVCYVDAWHFMHEQPEALLKLNYVYYSGGVTLLHLLRKNFIAPSTVMLRRSVIDRAGFFSEELRRSEDWEYWMRLAHRGAQFCFIPKVLGKIRLHADSMSYSWAAKMDERAVNLRILQSLSREILPEERRSLGMDRAIWYHRLLFAYTYSGNYFSPLQWLHRWIQRNRLT